VSVVSDVNKDPQYWTGVKEVTNVNASSNIIERDVTVVNDTKAHQIITLHPENSIVVNQTEGPITGLRIMTLTSLDVCQGAPVRSYG